MTFGSDYKRLLHTFCRNWNMCTIVSKITTPQSDTILGLMFLVHSYAATV